MGAYDDADRFEWYLKMMKHERILQRRALERLYPRTSRLPVWTDAAGSERDQAYELVLREWWHLEARTVQIASYLERLELRVRVLACLLCTESIIAFTDDPLIIECQHVMLGWVKGEVTDADAKTTRDVLKADIMTVPIVTDWEIRELVRHTFLGNVLMDSGRTAVHIRDMTDGPERNARYIAAHESLAGCLRVLYPDPSRIELSVGLHNWDRAVELARSLFVASAIRV